ncbi:M23 family metallopeptidase [Rhizobium sp. RAF56]|uniref:M23 family metallopeptidase n=1 Tax=Rhizobium sp. RAF56 TaxID=3233062 RepID=UPI003F98235E
MADNLLNVQYPPESAIPASTVANASGIPLLPGSPHLRHAFAVGLAACTSVALLSAVLYPIATRTAVAAAVPARPAEIVPPIPAMEKSARLATKRRFDGNRFAEVAEQLSSGETRIFKYHRTTLVFRGDSERAEATLVSARARPEIDDFLPGPSFLDFRDLTDTIPLVRTTAKRARLPLNGVPLNMSVAAAGPAPTREIKRLVTMPKSRQDLADILESAGVSADHREELARALATDAVAPGDSLELLLETDPSDAQPKLIMAKLNGEKGRHEKVVAKDDSNGFVPLADDRLFSTLYSEGQADAPSSSEVAAVDLKGMRGAGALKRRLENAGLSSNAVADLMRLAKANDVALDDSDDAPDSIDLLFRKSDDGKTELMFIEFHTGDEAHRFYLHRDGTDAPSEFYDEAGRSVAKVLAHKPVPGGKLGDGFAWRIHPVLGVKKFHNGVDFRAPMGSPILAAGDGIVSKISEETGYGKYVRIRHDSGYETTYAHIASAVSDLKVGQRVTQGQTIAFVGSTGYSTGPHLYYELRVNGRYEDPMTASLPAGTNLKGKSLANLRSQVDHVENIMSYLDVPQQGETSPFAVAKPQPAGTQKR